MPRPGPQSTCIGSQNIPGRFRRTRRERMLQRIATMDKEIRTVDTIDGKTAQVSSNSDFTRSAFSTALCAVAPSCILSSAIANSNNNTNIKQRRRFTVCHSTQGHPSRLLQIPHFPNSLRYSQRSSYWVFLIDSLRVSQRNRVFVRAAVSATFYISFSSRPGIPGECLEIDECRTNLTHLFLDLAVSSPHVTVQDKCEHLGRAPISEHKMAARIGRHSVRQRMGRGCECRVVVQLQFGWRMGRKQRFRAVGDFILYSMVYPSCSRRSRHPTREKITKHDQTGPLDGLLHRIRGGISSV